MAEETNKIRLEVSRDHITAYLHVKPGSDITLDDIHTSLEKAGIVFGIKEDEKINVFLNNMDLYDYTLVIASGKPFSYGRDAKIDYSFEGVNNETQEEVLSSNKKIDFRKVGSISSVKSGEVIARKIVAEQGEPGKTIFGQDLPGEWGMDITLNAGVNVSVEDNGHTYISKIDGAPIVSSGRIRVDPVHIIDGDVDFNTGNISFDGTVAISGSILDGFEVKASGDIIVENTIQSALVEAGGDVVVKRGILTRAKGLVYAEGNVYAKFIENSIVEAEGNVIVETAIMNSKVSVNGRVIAIEEEGSLIGGRTLAFDRIVVRNLGSQANPTTFVQVGYRFDVQKKYLEMLATLRTLNTKIEELQKNYDYASKNNNGDIEKLGEIRGTILKLDRVKKQLQDDISEVYAVRIFNNLAMIEVENVMFPGAVTFVGDSCYNVKKETSYASIKWDIDQKVLYLSTFDKSGKELKTAEDKRSRSVLIIDDSKAVRKTLRMIFEKMGLYVVDEAEDGEIGVEMYKKYKPRLVTCDIAMVNMDGVTTLKNIRSINDKAKIIMISSIKDKKKVFDCIVSGAFDYVLKPFVPSRVMTVVRSALDS